MTKVNVFNIVTDHFKTLVNSNTKKISFPDVVLFFGLPLILSAALVMFCSSLISAISSQIITVLSIFTGLLINVIVLLFDMIRRDNDAPVKNELLRQTLTNISYTVLISMVAIVVTIFTYIDYYPLDRIFEFLTYFFMSNIFCTLLMILKRIYNLFKTEAEN